VPSLLAAPRKSEGDGPFPAIIFLHGIGQKKEFLDEIAAFFTDEGFVFVSFDQHTRGERKEEGLSKLQEAYQFRRRAALTVIDTRRMIDYLETDPLVDPDRIYLVGASYGAITGSTAAAFDERIKATVLCYGGGDFQLLFSSAAAQDMVGIFTGPLASVLAWFISPADPVRYVDQIAPRPVLFQNGDHDVLIPLEAAYALYDAAENPKEITVYESNHVGDDEAHTIQVLKDAIAWIKKQDAA
jgi:dienelactone hydrolase